MEPWYFLAKLGFFMWLLQCQNKVLIMIHTYSNTFLRGDRYRSFVLSSKFSNFYYPPHKITQNLSLNCRRTGQFTLKTSFRIYIEIEEKKNLHLNPDVSWHDFVQLILFWWVGVGHGWSSVLCSTSLELTRFANETWIFWILIARVSKEKKANTSFCNVWPLICVLVCS